MTLGWRPAGPCRLPRPFFALLSTLSLLAGCASPPATLPLAASGRLAVQVAPEAGEPGRGFNASFELWGTAERGELQLRTSLGTWLATARWAPGQASLDTPQGQSTHTSLADLSQQAFGEALPLDALPDWLAGRPRATVPSQPCAPAAPNCFQQLGWQVDHTRRTDGLVVATRQQPPSVTVRVRLETPG